MSRLPLNNLVHAAAMAQHVPQWLRDDMERYQRAINNLHTVMIYNDVEELAHEARTKAYALPVDNHEYICEYLEQAYQDKLNGDLMGWGEQSDLVYERMKARGDYD